MRRFAIFMAVCLLACGLSACTSAPERAPFSAVRINEVQTSGSDGDWVELYNASDLPADLSGCFLTNDVNNVAKWQFPNGFTLAPKEHRVIYADNAVGDVKFNFRLSAGGTVLRLSTHQGDVVQELSIPAGASGLSYGYDEAKKSYLWYASPTPATDNQSGMVLGKENTVMEYGLRINEYMTRNRSVLYDENGDYSDWIELYNFSDSPINLGGYTLTDSRGEAKKWQFPADTIIAANGYLLVRCSKRNTVTVGGELHANFKLSDADSFIGLYTADGHFCSGVNYRACEQDRSRVYTDNGYRLCRIPTPGYENTTSYLEDTQEVTA